MQRLEVSGAVRLIYKSLGVKGLNKRTLLVFQCALFFSELEQPNSVATEVRKGCAFIFGLCHISDILPISKGTMS